MKQRVLQCYTRFGRAIVLSFVAGSVAAAVSSAAIRGQSGAPERPSLGEFQLPRVRSLDAAITTLIGRASESSTTFQQLATLINMTDGIVYLERGRCRYKVRACLIGTVTMAGPNRILRIVIDLARTACDVNLMASIAHELWHAIEVLREPSITSDSALFFFFARESPQHTNRFDFPFGAFETPAAEKVGVNVLAELRRVDPRACAHE